MNKEEELLLNIFDPQPWETDVRWCDLCEVFHITHPECKNSSCNGSSCDKCHKVFEDFHKNNKHCVEDYLTEEECLVFHKISMIKHRMSESLRKGESELDKETLDRINKVFDKRNDKKT